MITLKTLEQATAQEVFDQVAKHMLTQGVRSSGTIIETDGAESKGCKYRGDNGLMCAAGCLIADDEYNPEMENKMWEAMVRHGFAPPAHKDLIKYLQEVHDTSDAESWRKLLRNIAEMFNLEFRGEMYANT